jgi:predicted transcriptional regulator
MDQQVSGGYMPYSLSIWLDDDTAEELKALAQREERRRSEMVKVLIRRAAREVAREQNIAPGKTVRADNDIAD